MNNTTVRLPDLSKLLDQKRSELGRLQKLYEERLEQLRQRRDKLRAELRQVEAEISDCDRDSPKPRNNSAATTRARTEGRQAGGQAKKRSPAATNRHSPRSKPSHTSLTPPRSVQARLRNLDKIAARVLRDPEAIYRYERDGFLTAPGEDQNTTEPLRPLPRP